MTSSFPLSLSLSLDLGLYARVQDTHTQWYFEAGFYGIMVSQQVHIKQS
jgi:hypothetical protein